MPQTPAPTLVFIIGPPAVGKMTVGYEPEPRTVLSAAQVAERIIGHFSLPASTATG